MLKSNIKLFPALLLSVFLLAGCQKNLDSEIAQLKEKVRGLEKDVSAMNDQCKALSDIVAAIERENLITGVEELSDESYRITFSDGKTIVLRSGIDGVVPIMGIQKDSDTGFYYWTVQMGPQSSVKWLYDERGRRVRASAVVPKVKVEAAGDKDYWYYSFDEEEWYLLDGSGTTPAHGTPGLSVFSAVEYSSDGFVKITLANGSSFEIPTQAKFDALNAMCDTINNNMSVIADIVRNIDSNIFVRSIQRIEKEGELEGYDIEFENGRTFSLRNGKDSTEIKELSIGKNPLASNLCWMMDGEPILYNGEVVSAEPWNVIPVLGAVADEGVFYFTVKVGEGEPEFLLDSEGNRVQASPVRYFESITENNGALELTLNNVKINLIKMSDCTPSLHLKSESWEVAKSSEGSFIASIDSLGINKAEDFRYELEAVSMDSTCVIVSVGSGEFVSESPKKSIKHTVTFQLKESAAVGDKIRIAVFLTWDTHTIMKVAEVAVTEEQEAE